MAKPSKNAAKNSKKPAAAAPSRSASGIARSTPVRNSAVPKMTSRRDTTVSNAKSKNITHEMIAQRAYFISISGNGGSEHDNWSRAERELRSL